MVAAHINVKAFGERDAHYRPQRLEGTVQVAVERYGSTYGVRETLEEIEQDTAALATVTDFVLT